MNLVQVVLVAVRALLRNPLRSFLTALGVVIGVGCVIAMTSIGAGARARVDETFASMGSNMLIVRSGESRSGGARGGAGTQPTLTWDDLEAIQNEVPAVAVAAPLLVSPAQFLAEGQNWASTVQGTTPVYFGIRNWSIGRGRFFDDADVEAGAKVIVLGQTVVDNLFGAFTDPLGQIVRVNRVPFEVIGVAAAKGQSAFGSDNDDVAFVPVTSYRSRIEGGLAQFLSGTIFASAVSAVRRGRRRASIRSRRCGTSSALAACAHLSPMCLRSHDSHLAKTTTRNGEVLPKALWLEIRMIRPPEDVTQRDAHTHRNERIQDSLVRVGKLSLAAIAAQEGSPLVLVPGAPCKCGDGRGDIAGEGSHRAIRKVERAHGAAIEQVVALVEVTMQNPDVTSPDVAQECACAIDLPPEPCKRGRSQVGTRHARKRKTLANERTPIRVGKPETSGEVHGLALDVDLCQDSAGNLDGASARARNGRAPTEHWTKDHREHAPTQSPTVELEQKRSVSSGKRLRCSNGRVLGKLLEERRLEVGSSRILMRRAIDPKNQPLPAIHLDTKHGVADEAKKAKAPCADAELRESLVGYPAKQLQLAGPRERFERNQSRTSEWSALSSPAGTAGAGRPPSGSASAWSAHRLQTFTVLRSGVWPSHLILLGGMLDVSLISMTLKARVHAGRLILDEPTTLPEGTEVELLPLDPGDWLDDADRAALHAALAESDVDVAAGRLIDGADLLRELRAR